MRTEVDEPGTGIGPYRCSGARLDDHNTVAQARGVAILSLAQRELSIAEYTPSAVKLAVTGYGAARKEQVGYIAGAAFWGCAR